MATTLQAKETTTKALAGLPADLQGSWGAEGVDNSDILIPRLMLMQGLSDFVTDGSAKLGDIVRSTTGEVLATKDKPLAIIPILTHKTWVTLEKVGNKFEFRSIEPVNPTNATAPLEWQQQGSLWRRDLSLEFFVLLPSDIARERKALDKITAGEMPDAADALFPCHLSFRRTSYQAGKVLSTHFSTAGRFKLPPASSTFHLSSETVKNDQGTFAVLSVKVAGKTSMDDLAVAKRWYDILAAAQAKNRVAVDEVQAN